MGSLGSLGEALGPSNAPQAASAVLSLHPLYLSG